jgi:hypothetical protein
MAASISKSVGKGGINLAADVKTVRDLLAPWAKNAGLPAFGSGAMDQRMIEAILRFQSDELHRATPDGRIDPDGGTFAALLKFAEAEAKAAAAALAAPSQGTAKVAYGSGVDTDARLVSGYSMKVIERALHVAKVDAAVITSTLRKPGEQAAAMYKNAVKDLAAQFALYGATGDEILKVFQKNRAKDTATVISLMAAKIEELVTQGKRVSLHVVTPASYAALNVIDIGVGSTRAAAGISFKLGELTKAFAKLEADGYIRKFIDETAKTNACWHLEIVPGAKAL